MHIDLNLGPDTPNKVTNQAGFCTMCEIAKQYLNKIIQSTRKCLKYRLEKFLRQPNPDDTSKTFMKFDDA